MTRANRSARGRSFLGIFGAPLLLALLSAVGLLSALLGDGTWDVVSWFALGVPVATVLWYWCVAPSASRTAPAGSRMRRKSA